VQAALAAPGQQVQQLTQLLAPGAQSPEQRQRLAQRQPVAARAQQLGEEHGPLAPLAFAQGLGVGWRGGGEGGGGGSQTVGVVEVEQAGDDGAMAMAPFVTQEALKAFTERLVEAFAPEQVILFGSMARGTVGVESDADVLVVMPFEGRALDKILEIRNVCQPEFPLDMLLWRPEDIPRRYRWGDPFIRDALDHGVVLHG
jgi:uncharacterized protein